MNESSPREREGYWARRVRRHVLIASAASLVTALLFRLAREKPSFFFRASMATGYTSVFLIAAVLALGPYWLWRARPVPTSVDLRRDLGIWGAVFGLLHVATGLFVHMRGDPWNYFIYRPRDGAHAFPLRLDGFGMLNWVGLAATLLLVLLLAISNDWSLRTLGATRWKQLQRSTYVAGALIVLHGVAFQLADRRARSFIAIFAATIVAVVAIQLDGRRRMRARIAARRASAAAVR